MTTTINPYLIFNGNCEDAFNFYKSVFGGEFEYIGRFSEMPQEDGCSDIPENYANKIMHVCFPIGKETYLMGSDNNPEFGKVTFGQNMNISINTDTKHEADRLFAGLSDKATVIMPMKDMFWGDYFGMLTDKFGVMWMISYRKPQ